jgi:hypothetical protein
MLFIEALAQFMNYYATSQGDFLKLVWVVIPIIGDSLNYIGFAFQKHDMLDFWILFGLN